MEENNKLIIAVIAIVLALSLFGGGGMMWLNSTIGMWFFGPLFMLLAVIALILFIIWLIKQIQENKKGGRKK